VERAYIEAESKKLLSCRTESELTGVSSGIPKEEFTLKHFLHRRYRNTHMPSRSPSDMTVSKWVYVLRKQNLKKYVVMPGRSCNGKCDGIPNDEFYTDHILPMRYRNTRMPSRSPSGMTVSEWVYVLRKQNLKSMLSCRTESELASVTASPMIRKNFIVFFIGDTGTHACPLAARPV
jgi:hypothetical protein